MNAEQDRREQQAPRIPFEAIVEIGAADGHGAGFEAESVDLSSGGMHVRTAYLPELGQKLLCRFDAGGREVSAEGSVAWREQGARGGEFGIQFTTVEGPNAEALLEMCGVRAEKRPSADPAGDAGGDVGRGTRVRLHIDGLGSPMKARVRDAGDASVLVGSNLEFLRVGRTIELEDVDHRCTRPAHIDRVEVEVDPASRVPQLVVSLRYDDVLEELGASDVASGPSLEGLDGHPMSIPTRDPIAAEPRMRTAERAAEEPMHDEEIEAAQQMKSGVSRAALEAGEAVTRLSARARTTLALLWAKAANRGADELDADAPRRTTAPAPSGALHAAGKRVVRDEDEAIPGVPSATPRGRKALAIGGAATLVALIAFAAVRKSSAPPPGAETVVPADTITATLGDAGSADPAAIVAATPTPPAAALPADIAQAQVPLYGATPLSTTEPAQAAAPTPDAGADPMALAQAAAPLGGPSLAPAPAGEEPTAAAEPAGEPSADANDEPASAAHATKKSTGFAHGKVTHPVVLRLHTDGAIAQVKGARTPTGFHVVLPGRKFEGSAAQLAAKDPRIASAKISSGAKGAELSVQFKDGVPPFSVRGKGSDLTIALGRIDADKGDKVEKTEKVASRKAAKDKDAKHGATAKKGAAPAHGHKPAKK